MRRRVPSETWLGAIPHARAQTASGHLWRARQARRLLLRLTSKRDQCLPVPGCPVPEGSPRPSHRHVDRLHFMCSALAQVSMGGKAVAAFALRPMFAHLHQKAAGPQLSPLKQTAVFAICQNASQFNALGPGFRNLTSGDNHAPHRLRPCYRPLPATGRQTARSGGNTCLNMKLLPKAGGATPP